jgi:hypothetical protein
VRDWKLVQKRNSFYDYDDVKQVFSLLFQKFHKAKRGITKNWENWQKNAV